MKSPAAVTVPVVVVDTPSQVTVKVWLGVNPLPLSVTTVPTGPELGSMVSGMTVGPVTVNVSESKLVPATAMMVWVPVVAVAGIVTTLEKVPSVPVTVLPLVGVSVVPSNLNVSVVLATKLIPLTVTELPAAPDAGVRVIVAVKAATVKVALRVVEPAVTEMV